ncbi:MAG: Cys-tRNA(Pro) deacylase [Acidimicrobiales bacterium]
MTPAVLQLDAAGIAHTIHTYDHDPDASAAAGGYGLEAATVMGVDPDQVFKTLLASLGGGDHDGELVVAVVPVSQMLDLKALARVAGAKKATMAQADAAERSTGYVVGGISPFGQRTPLRTFVDDWANALDTMLVSGGRRGLEIELAPTDLVAVLEATTGEIAG